MPLVYNGRRGAMEDITKLAVWRALVTLVCEARSTNPHPTWEDLAALASEYSSKSTRCARLLMKEEHIPTTQAETAYSRLAFGVTTGSVVDKRFSIITAFGRKRKRSEEQVAPIDHVKRRPKLLQHQNHLTD